MPVALTNSPIVYQTFTASSRSVMIEAVNAALKEVGWTSVAVTGGYRLQGVSPQGMQVYLYVRDKGHSFYSPQVTYNFQTVDGSITGIDHEISIDASRTYQILCGVCYSFISNVGSDRPGDGSSFCGGIPFIPGASPCGSVVPASDPPSQSFWAMSDKFGGASPRWSLILAGDQNMCEALWGTDYCAPGNRVGSVRIPALCPANNIGGGFNLPSPVRWHNGDYVTIEPFLVWGLTNTDLAIIRAQIYDAMVFSWIQPADKFTTRFGFRWMNYTHNWNNGSLNNIMPAASAVVPHPPVRKGNYAFTAT